MNWGYATVAQLGASALVVRMARRLRIQFPGAIYHVINRGNYRRELFATEGAARAFERALGEACLRFGWRVHAFVAMGNHFHLALTTPFPDLGEGMHWLQTTFAVRFNRFRSESGHLFQGRYQSPLVEDARALLRVVDYIHLNPVRAGLAPPADAAAFRWCSLARFVHGPRPAWLTACEWLAELRLDDSPTAWSRYAQHLATLHAQPTEDEAQDFDDISRGRPVGTAGWRRALARSHQHRALEPDLPRDEALPLKEARWRAALKQALAGRPATPEIDRLSTRIPRWKVAIAATVRRSSGAPYRWIAQELHVASASSLRAAVCWLDRR